MRPFFNLFAHFEVRGLENLTGLTRPVIFAPNHSNEIDSILIPLALPVWSRFSPLFYVVREQKFYDDPFFGWRGRFYAGWIFKILGAFPIVSGVKDYAVSLAAHVKILKEGGSVCIFPEGAFTKTGEIGTGHGGVGYLASATHIPIIPVYISGTFKFSLSELLLGKCHIQVTFLPAIEMGNDLRATLTADEYKRIATMVLDAIRTVRTKSNLIPV